MIFDEFTGEIQHRLELPGTGETVRAIRATLMTLGQRSTGGCLSRTGHHGSREYTGAAVRLATAS